MTQEKKTMKPVDIIVITYQRLNYLKILFNELSRNTEYPYRLIVIDNGSIDGTREWIEKMYKKGKIWKYLFNKENEMLSESFQMGLELVESELFITTQDDIIPPKLSPCWLTQMVELMKEKPKLIAITMDYVNEGIYRYLTQRYGKKRAASIVKK